MDLKGKEKGMATKRLKENITSSLTGGLGFWTFLIAKAGVAIGFLTAAVLICKAEGGR